VAAEVSEPSTTSKDNVVEVGERSEGWGKLAGNLRLLSTQQRVFRQPAAAKPDAEPAAASAVSPDSKLAESVAAAVAAAMRAPLDDVQRELAALRRDVNVLKRGQAHEAAEAAPAAANGGILRVRMAGPPSEERPNNGGGTALARSMDSPSATADGSLAF
jgi:hypothetical protein